MTLTVEARRDYLYPRRYRLGLIEARVGRPGR